MKAIIVGGGKLTYFLARTLVSKGYSVTVVNRDAVECTSLARRVDATVVLGDGSDPQVLGDAGADGTDALLAVTPNDEDNLVISQLAATRFRIPRTIALANDPDNEEVLRTLGVRAVSTTRVLASVIEQSAGFEEITNLLPVGEGKVNLTEITLDEDCPLCGVPLRQAPIPDDALIACVLRDDQPVIPRGSTTLAPGDRVILLTLPESHGDAVRAFTGES